MSCVDKNVNNTCTAVSEKRRKTVRFAPEPNVLNAGEQLEELSNQERRDGWWQLDERRHSIASAKSLCRKIKQEGGSKGILIDALERACSIASSGSDLEAVPNEGLVHWCSRTSDNVRGLERWACAEYVRSWEERRSEFQHAVLLEQARQVSAEVTDQEAIARVAQEKSETSRVFAALLGQADAATAKQQEHPRRRSSIYLKGLQPNELFDVPLDPISDGNEETTCPLPIVISVPQQLERNAMIASYINGL